MIPLKAKESKPYDIISILKSKHIQELQFNYFSIKSNPRSNEEDQISEENFNKVFSDFNKFAESYDESQYNSLILCLSEFYMMIYNKEDVPQEMITAIKSSDVFFQSIRLCISVLRLPEILILFWVLQCLVYLSSELSEAMFKNGILDELMKIFVDTTNQASARALFYLFGNTCSIEEVSFHFQEILFCQLGKFLPISENSFSDVSIPTQAACIYCLFVLSKYFRMPDAYVCSFLQYFKNPLMRLEEILKHENEEEEEEEKQHESDESIEKGEYDYDDEDDENEEEEGFSPKKYLEKIAIYIIDILERYSKDEDGSKNIIITTFPSFILGIIQSFPCLIQQEFLTIIKNTLQQNLAEMPEEYKLLLFSQADIFTLESFLDSSNNKIISIVYDILFEIEFINDLAIKDLISRNIIGQTIKLINSVNFCAKISILNFLSVLLVKDVKNEYSHEIVTKQIVEDFVEIAEQREDLYFMEESNEIPLCDKLKPICIGAISKLYNLTSDQQELNSLLMPFVIEEVYE